MTWGHIYIVAFLISLASALVLTPVFKKIAEYIKFYDQPNKQEHNKHAKATPLLGGPAVFLSWLMTITLGFMAIDFVGPLNFSSSVMSNIPGVVSVSGRLMVICAGAFFAVLLGLLDDRYTLKALPKFTAQFLIAAMTVTWGEIKITAFINDPVVTWLISVFWFLLIFNAINFFDNMDGLAAGTASIALCLFSITAAMNSQYFVAVLGAAGAGATIGFWFFNHTPAKIFLGDSGSHFLGYILAVISASVTYYHPEYSTTKFPILIPFFILAIPLFDTAAVIAIRLYNHKPVYVGDHNHISHRFVRMGMPRKKAVFLIHLLELIIGLSVLPLLWGDERTSVISIIQACTLLLFVSVIQYIDLPSGEKSPGNQGEEKN